MHFYRGLLTNWAGGMSAASPSYQASPGVQMANDTAERAPAFRHRHGKTTQAALEWRAHYNRHKKAVKTKEFYTRGDLGISLLEIYWMWCLSLIASVLSSQHAFFFFLSQRPLTI